MTHNIGSYDSFLLDSIIKSLCDNRAVNREHVSKFQKLSKPKEDTFGNVSRERKSACSFSVFFSRHFYYFSLSYLLVRGVRSNTWLRFLHSDRKPVDQNTHANSLQIQKNSKKNWILSNSRMCLGRISNQFLQYCCSHPLRRQHLLPISSFNGRFDFFCQVPVSRDFEIFTN